jgi:hypothetical protein
MIANNYSGPCPGATNHKANDQRAFDAIFYTAQN